MRVKGYIAKNFLKGYMTASILDSMMNQDSPFEDDSKIVLTGSAITYYLWHKGISQDYYYKPPTDIDFVLTRNQLAKKSTQNISHFNKIMADFCISSARNSDFDIVSTIPDRYETLVKIKKTFTPDEVHEIICNSRLKEVMDDYGINKIDISSPIEISTKIDTMVLDSTVLKSHAFSNCHPNAENSALRHQSLTSSLGFKLARSILAKLSEEEQRPGDVLDIYNIVNSNVYEHNPELIRIMTVVWLATQVPSNFNSYDLTAEMLQKDPEEVHRELEKHYKGKFSKILVNNHVDLWNKIAQDAFPDLLSGSPILTKEEDDFIMNVLVPQSGSPSESIIPELLQGKIELKEVFDQNRTLTERIKTSTFFQKRVAFRQISPCEIEI